MVHACINNIKQSASWVVTHFFMLFLFLCDHSPFVSDLSSVVCQKHVNYCWFCISLDMFLVNFCHVLICCGLIIFGLFYTYKVVFHVFTCLKIQKENGQRKVQVKMHEQKKKKEKIAHLLPIRV